MTQQLPQYDFYATPTGAPSPAPAASATPSAPAYGTAVNQFGTPLGVPGASLPAAATAAAPVRSSGGVRVPGWLWRWALGLAVAAVLGLFGVGRLGFLDVVHHAPEPPATLAGAPLSTNGDAEAMRADALANVSGVDEDDFAVAVYEDPSQYLTLIVVERSATQEDLRFLLDAEDGVPVQAVGDALCRDIVEPGVTVGACASSSGGRSVMVMQGPGTTASAHTALLEAWGSFD